MKVTASVLAVIAFAYGMWTLWVLSAFSRDPLFLVSGLLWSFGTPGIYCYAEIRAIAFRDRTATILCILGWGLLAVTTFLQAASVMSIEIGWYFFLLLAMAIPAALLTASHTFWLIRQESVTQAHVDR